MENIDTIEKFYNYKNIYNQILKDNNYSIPFAEFSFMVNWWDFFGKGRKLLIILTKKNGTITGFAPLMISKKGFLSQVNFIGYPLATDMDFILDSENRASTIAEILDYLYKLPGNFLINLNGLREDSPNFKFIKKWTEEKKETLFLNYSQEPYICINQSFDQYSKDFLNSHFIKNLRRRDRMLKNMGDFKYKKIESEDFDKIFDIHQDRWKLRYDTSNFSEEKYRDFFKSIYIEKDKGYEMDISIISLDNEPIAFCLGLIKNNMYLLYSSSYYDSFSILGLGQLIKKYKIEECFNNKLSCFSFGTGYEPYKKQWTNNYTNVYKLVFKTYKCFFPAYLHLLKEAAITLIKKNHKIIMFRRNKIGTLMHTIKGLNIIKIKFFIRKIIKYLLVPLGILFSSLKKEEGQIIMLLYHRVNDSIDKELSVKYENFKYQMEYLKNHNYSIISLQEGLDMIHSKKITGRNVIISFDDGYRDFYINAYPILSRLNFKCILYIAPGFIESGKCFWWDKDIGESSLLSWTQIQSLSKKDLITIGSHTMNHLDLRKLNGDEQNQELSLSKIKLEDKISKEVSDFSFPQGFVNEAAKTAVKKIYKSGVLLSNGAIINNKLKTDEVFALKRTAIQKSDGKYLFIARLKGWLILEETAKKVIKRLF